MKTIGTLEEIGAQVGDVVNNGNGYTYTLGVNFLGHYTDSADGCELVSYNPSWRIITKAAKSPVRTVTRIEIVPGIYGKVSVHQLRPDNGGYYIAMVDSLIDKERTVHSPMTLADLTAAIKTLTEIRDVMAGDE